MQQGATNGCAGRSDPLYEAYRALAEVEAASSTLAAYARLWVKKKEEGRGERGVARVRVGLLPSADLDGILKALEAFDSVIDRAIVPVYAYVGAVAASTGDEDVAAVLRELARRLREHRRALAALRESAGSGGNAVAARAAVKAAVDLSLYMRRAVDVAASAARQGQEKAATRPRPGVRAG